MLVLSRQKNESIMIGEGVTIVVVDIRGDKVRLGIEAPKETSVHRREVYDAIRRQDQQAKAAAASKQAAASEQPPLASPVKPSTPEADLGAR